MKETEIIFSEATQIDNDGNIWQVTFNPKEQDCKQFKIRVNKHLNILAGESFPPYFKKYFKNKGVYSVDNYSSQAQVQMAVLDNFVAVTCIDANAEVYCLPIHRLAKERRGEGKFKKLDLPVSDEWSF